MDPARGIRGDGGHKPAVHLSDLKGGVGDALGFVALADLDKLQPSDGRVVEGQGLNLAGLDLHALRSTVQNIHRPS